MTNQDTTSIDEQLAKIMDDYHAGGYGEEYEQILKLIAQETTKARIDELKHIVSGSEYSADDFDWYELTRNEYTGTKYYSEVRHLDKDARIAELQEEQTND